MSILRKFTAVIAAAVITSAVFTACGSTETGESGQSAAQSGGEQSASKSYSLSVAGTADNLTNPLVQLADEAGYFSDYGLSVSKTILGNIGSETYDSLSVGKVDAAYVQAVPPISYGAQGYDVTLIGGTLSGGMVAVVLPENYDELKDVSNWVGHSVGVIQMSTSELTVRNALKHDYDLDPDTDVKFVMIEDYPSISLSTLKGNVDIGFIGSQYVDAALDQGLVVLTTLYDIKKDYVCCRQSAYSKKLEEDRDAYVAYLQGQIKAYKDINTDQDTTVKSLAKATGESEQYIYDYIYDTEASAHRTYNPDPNYNGVQGLYEIMQEQGYIDSDRPLNEFYDLSVYADALKNVIAENPGDTFYTDMRDYFKANNNEYPDFDSIYGDSFWG